MAKRNDKSTRNKIVNAAWQLFYEQGFAETTVEEIIALSHTSKGSFYHYFSGKEALLGTLSTLFDEQYEALEAEFPADMPAMDKLLQLNAELFGMIENRIPIGLLSGLLAQQITANGEKQLLDHNRTYYKLLRKIMLEGQAKGELTREMGVGEMVKVYALCERALMYDWCLCGGEYSLKQYSVRVLPTFLSGLKEK